MPTHPGRGTWSGLPAGCGSALRQWAGWLGRWRRRVLGRPRRRRRLRVRDGWVPKTNADRDNCRLPAEKAKVCMPGQIFIFRFARYFPHQWRRRRVAWDSPPTRTRLAPVSMATSRSGLPRGGMAGGGGLGDCEVRGLKRPLMESALLSEPCVVVRLLHQRCRAGDRMAGGWQWRGFLPAAVFGACGGLQSHLKAF